MWRHIFLVFLLPTLFSCTTVRNNPDEREWVQLFNGKNLDGWDVKITGYDLNDNFGNTFRVEDGMLTVRYDAYDKFNERFGHIFYEKPYSYYLVAAEYRFIDKQANEGPGWAFRNSGIMVHGQSAASMGKDQDFPISIEVQLLGGPDDGSKRTTANLCTPGTNVVYQGKLDTRHCINSNSDTFPAGEWVRAEVLVLGDSLVRHIVNGKPVLEYTQPQIGGGNVSNHDPKVKQDGKLLAEGTISLQAESHPVQYRKVEVLDLTGCKDPKAKNYKSYIVKHDASRCKY